MASSGSVDFNLTTNQIIKDALVHCRAIAQGEDPPAEMTAAARRQLNRMVKTWEVDGVRLWTRREAILFPQKSQARYLIGPSATEHTAEIDDAFRTELAAAVAVGGGSLTVDDDSDMAVSDNIGVLNDSDQLEWFTISALPGSNVVTLSGTLATACSVDASVYTYTTKIGRPTRITSAVRRNSEEIDTPIIVVSHDEYNNTPNKAIDGLTNNLYYHPTRPQASIELWPRPATADMRIKMTCEFQIEDFDATSDNPDFPQEWLDCLTWNLADLLVPGYGTPERTAQRIMKNATETYFLMANHDIEPTGTFFQPAEY